MGISKIPNLYKVHGYVKSSWGSWYVDSTSHPDVKVSKLKPNLFLRLSLKDCFKVEKSSWHASPRFTWGSPSRFTRLLTCPPPSPIYLSLSPTSACPTMRGYISRTTWAPAVLFSIGGRHGDDDDDRYDGDEQILKIQMPKVTTLLMWTFLLNVASSSATTSGNNTQLGESSSRSKWLTFNTFLIAIWATFEILFSAGLTGSFQCSMWLVHHFSQ